jgi:hypothetical protein
VQYFRWRCSFSDRIHSNEAESEPAPATGRVNVLREQSAAPPVGAKCDLSPLREAVCHFDSFHLAASCGALALLPENASRIFRVEALAHVAGTLTTSSDALITPQQLQGLFHQPPLSTPIGNAEDPFPNLFVEEVPFFGGSYRIFPGPTTGTSFSFQRLTACIFQASEWPKEFASQIYDLVKGSLFISDLLAERSDLKRGARGDATERGEIYFPADEKFDILRGAVTFSSDELESCFHRAGIDAQSTSDLVVNAGDFTVADHGICDGLLVRKPIVRYGDQFIVAAPQRLLAATNHLIVRRIIEYEMQHTYSAFYPDSVLSSVNRALAHLRHAPINFTPTSPIEIPGARERFYRFDSDKFLYLLMVCDTLEGFDPSSIDAFWGSPALSGAIVERVKQVSKEFFFKIRATNDIFCLLVPSSVDRTHEFALNDWPDEVPLLALDPDDLETIARVEAGNSLVLWKFAQRTTEMLGKLRLICFDELDLFAAYRDRNYSYYPGDREIPKEILIKPGYGTKLRIKVANEQDWHPVRYFDPNLIVTVHTLYGTRSVPLYGIPDSESPCICVEELPCLVWVYADDSPEDSNHPRQFDCICAVAYWIWQLASFLNESIAEQMRSLPMLHVQVSLCSELVNGVFANTPSNEPPVEAEVAELGIIRLSLRQVFWFLLRSTDNIAEREILRQLLPALVRAAGGTLQMTQEQIDNVVDKVAPVGLKRMLVRSELAYVPEMDNRDLPEYRAIQAGDLEQVIDEASQHVITARGLKPGRIEPAICNAVLNEMVAFCFNEIKRLVKTLRPNGLLEVLITLCEAVIHESAFKQLTVATRLRTFAEDNSMMGEIAGDMAEFTRAGMAARFIIEFVAAQPPRGLRRMSFEIYDRLQALATMLTVWGSSSDTLHFGLSEISLSVSRAGRILIRDAQYSMAMMMQLSGLAADRLLDSENVFRKHMGEHTEPADSDFENSEPGRATRAEFGHSLMELNNFLIALGDIAMDLKLTTPAIMERGALLATLAKELQWDAVKVEHCLDLFSLAPRENYLSPPPQCRKEDLYPWRFNREISYLRRPLLMRVRDGMTEVLWGHRHVDMARSYLVQLCASTRLKAKSPEMRSLLAKYRHDAGGRFNDAVYDGLKQFPHLIVAKKVRKVDHLDMAHLGDIDILCADLNQTVLWVIECKSLALARTPYEMRSELEGLTLSTDDQISTLKKHEARSAWVQHHLSLVLKWLGANPGRNWTVRPLIVMETIPISPLLRDVSMPMISFDMLKKKLGRTE